MRALRLLFLLVLLAVASTVQGKGFTSSRRHLAQNPVPVDAINAAVAAAQASQSASAAALAAVLALQANITQQANVTQQPPIAATVGGGPAPTIVPPRPEVPTPVAETFAVPGFETPLAGTEGAGAVPFAGLMTPTAEVGAVLGEKGGLPPQAVPQGLPERLAASLQGEQPLVQG